MEDSITFRILKNAIQIVNFKTTPRKSCSTRFTNLIFLAKFHQSQFLPKSLANLEDAFFGATRFYICHADSVRLSAGFANWFCLGLNGNASTLRPAKTYLFGGFGGETEVILVGNNFIANEFVGGSATHLTNTFLVKLDHSSQDGINIENVNTHLVIFSPPLFVTMFVAWDLSFPLQNRCFSWKHAGPTRQHPSSIEQKEPPF